MDTPSEYSLPAPCTHAKRVPASPTPPGSAKSMKEFVVVTPSQRIARRPKYPFPSMTDPKPSTKTSSSEPVSPLISTSSPYVRSDVDANIGRRRRRANALSLADLPSRPGHSQAMVKIFEDAQRSIEREDQGRRILSPPADQTCNNETQEQIDPRMPLRLSKENQISPSPLGTVRINRPKQAYLHVNSCTSLLKARFSCDAADDVSNLQEEACDPVYTDASEGMPLKEIKTWLDSVSNDGLDQTAEPLSRSPSNNSSTSTDENQDARVITQSSPNKENSKRNEVDSIRDGQSPSSTQRANCLSTLLKSGPLRYKIGVSSPTCNPQNSLATKWPASAVPSQQRGRPSRRLGSDDNGQPKAPSAFVTEQATVIVDDSCDLDSKSSSSDSNEEGFTDAKAFPSPLNLDKLSLGETRVESNIITKVNSSSSSESTSCSVAPGLLCSPAIKVAKRKSPENTTELYAALFDPEKSSQIFEASGFKRESSSYGRGHIPLDKGANPLSTVAEKSMEAMPSAVTKFRTDKGPTQPRCPSYYDEDLEETASRPSLRSSRRGTTAREE